MSIILKNSPTPGKIPLTSDLDLGELAINTSDAIIYTKKGDGSIVTIGGGTDPTKVLKTGDTMTGALINNSAIEGDCHGRFGGWNAADVQFGGPAVELVFADTSGGIGYVSSYERDTPGYFPLYVGGDPIKLQHDGSTKLETTTTGIDVTGAANVDSIVSGPITGTTISGTAISGTTITASSTITATGNITAPNFVGRAETTEVIDTRTLGDGDIAYTPSQYGANTARFSFGQNTVPDSGNIWDSVLSVKGWSGTYGTWQIWGPADQSYTAGKSLYFRYGNDASWGVTQKILTDENFGDQSILIDNAGVSPLVRVQPTADTGWPGYQVRYSTGAEWAYIYGNQATQDLHFRVKDLTGATKGQLVFDTSAFAARFSGSVTATSNIVAYYSDERLKDISKPISGALDAVNKWRAVHYTANEVAATFGYDTSKEEIGLLTQDIEKDFPQVIEPAPISMDKELPENDYKTLQYDRVVAVLVAAVQELTEKVKRLESERDNTL